MDETKDRLEQREEIVCRLNGMDDTFFQKLAESRKVYEEMVRILSGDHSIILTGVETQKYLRNCGSRSVILDAIGVDAQNRYYCMEMEKSEKHDHQKRVRYNLSNVDTLVTEKGAAFKELPEIHSVYVIKKDFFGGRRTRYCTPRVLAESGEALDNGVHEVYINAQVDDGTVCAELMQYLKHTDLTEEHPAFPKTVARVRYLKQQQRGQEEVCELVEKYAREVAAEEVEKAMAEAAKEKAEVEWTRREMVRNMFRRGASMEFVRDCAVQFTEEELCALQKEARRERKWGRKMADWRRGMRGR